MKAEALKEESEQVTLSFSESLDELFGIEKQKTTYSALAPKKEVIKEEVVKPEPKKTRHELNMERAGAALSLLESKKPKKPIIIKEGKSVEERLALLEQDVFDQMSKGTPNTLVSGIGASLDSGGGAVWLWDLEDVNIGTPPVSYTHLRAHETLMNLVCRLLLLDTKQLIQRLTETQIYLL